MTVPSHNLYDFVHQVTEKRFWLVYFYPWGSRDLNHVVNYISDAKQLYSASGLDPDHCVAKHVFPNDMDKFFWRVEELQPVLYCHDQEPLNFDLYTDNNLQETDIPKYGLVPRKWLPKNQNLRYARPMSNQKQFVLLHSELNSLEVQRYEDTDQYHCAYWWSHAVLARDWYRFAEQDKRLSPASFVKKMFLIYCRDTTGTRQYRQQFLTAVEKIKGNCQFQSFNDDNITSASSATYSPDDFNNTAISVVLETVFWDQRIHLTEKILRAIACGHPFMLAAGPGSLKLLKHYGFETFEPWINESYDCEADHQTRLDSIVNEMHRINSLSIEEKKLLVAQCLMIAQRNKHRFFSKEFYCQVAEELHDNVAIAGQKIKDQFDLTYYQALLEHTDNKLKTWVTPFVDYVTQGGSLEQYQRHKHGLDDESSTNGDNV
jgi:hypothetical protein